MGNSEWSSIDKYKAKKLVDSLGVDDFQRFLVDTINELYHCVPEDSLGGFNDYLKKFLEEK